VGSTSAICLAPSVPGTESLLGFARYGGQPLLRRRKARKVFNDSTFDSSARSPFVGDYQYDLTPTTDPPKYNSSLDMKRSLLAVPAWLSLILGTTGYLLSQTQDADHQSLVTISWQVRLDNAQGFDFSNLRALIQYRPARGRAWVPLPMIKLDSTGTFISTIPAGNWVSRQIGTADPTIRDLTGKADPFRPYTLGDKETQTVLDQEFYVESDSLGTLQKGVQLERGAAFKLCIPMPMKTWRIFYRLRSDKSKRVNVIFFIDSSDSRDHTVAGLVPGH
jgi:hypothetical protein